MIAEVIQGLRHQVQALKSEAAAEQQVIENAEAEHSKFECLVKHLASADVECRILQSEVMSLQQAIKGQRVLLTDIQVLPNPVTLLEI